MSHATLETPDPDNAALTTLKTRRSVGAAALIEPAPTPHEIRQMLTIAARVPDHGGLVPWRFLLVEHDNRGKLAEALIDAHAAAATTDDGAREQVPRVAQKLRVLFGQPPLVVLVISRPDPASHIAVSEQLASAGAVCMNLMNAAGTLGYASNWLTGWTASHPAARPVLGLADGETVVGIIPIGTAREQPADRPRPDLSQIVSSWVA